MITLLAVDFSLCFVSFYRKVQSHLSLLLVLGLLNHLWNQEKCIFFLNSTNNIMADMGDVKDERKLYHWLLLTAEETQGVSRQQLSDLLVFRTYK